MSDEENQPESKNSSSKSEKRVNNEFIKTPSGFLMLINMILAFLAFCLVSAWLNDVPVSSGHFSFFTYACTHTWVALLIIFILRLVRVPEYLKFLHWNLAYFINALIFTIIMFIGSCMIVDRLVKWRKYSCDHYQCGLLGACVFFGFLTMLGCAVETFFHFKDYKSE